MPRTKEYIQKLSQQMIENDDKLIKHYQQIDRMINLDWDLPKEIKALKWMRKVISTDPQSALKTATRTLSTEEPVPYYQPTNPNPDTQKEASKTEMNLLWQLKQADKRSKNRIVSDIVESSLRYDKVVAQTIPLKWQLEGQADMEGEMPSRYKAAENLGSFMVIVHNPKNIHARWTPLGLDAVLSAKVMSAREAIAFYGKNADELKMDVEDEEGEMFVTVFDYWDYDQRLTWCSAPKEIREMATPLDEEYVFIEDEMEMDFLGGWTVAEGGTSLEVEQENSVRPLLGTIAKSDLWETQNIAQSISFSEAIGYSAAPRYKISGPASDEVQVDYGDINKPIRLRGGEDVTPMQPPTIDQNLLHIADRIQAAMDKDTVAKLLQNLDLPSGTAFATVNAMIKTATSALEPHKQLAERALADIMENMLRWTHYTKDPLRGYGYHENDVGEQYKIEPEFINPSGIYIDVKLSAHVPTDYLQRIEAAIALNQQLEFPMEEAYKHLDVTNPDVIRDKWEQERLSAHELQLYMRQRAADTDLQIQAKQMQMQMQAQQAAQQQQAPPTQSEQRLNRQGGSPNPQQMRRAMQGNPARTGNSPNQSNPERNLRERVNRQDSAGEETL